MSQVLANIAQKYTCSFDVAEFTSSKQVVAGYRDIVNFSRLYAFIHDKAKVFFCDVVRCGRRMPFHFQNVTFCV